MNFSELLTVEQRKQILTSRLEAFYVEAYQVNLHTEVARATGDQASLDQSLEGLKVLETAIKVYSAELESLA
jgi:hypothetical protein